MVMLLMDKPKGEVLTNIFEGGAESRRGYFCSVSRNFWFSGQEVLGLQNGLM